jgi:hypothetical protein
MAAFDGSEDSALEAGRRLGEGAIDGLSDVPITGVVVGCSWMARHLIGDGFDRPLLRDLRIDGVEETDKIIIQQGLDEAFDRAGQLESGRNSPA